MGHIIEEIQIEETKVSFCNDYFRDRTDDEIKDILNKAAAQAAKYLAQRRGDGKDVCLR